MHRRAEPGGQAWKIWSEYHGLRTHGGRGDWGAGLDLNRRACACVIPPAATILAVVLGGPAVAAETSANGLLRVSAVWGDDRYVSGGISEAAASNDGRRVAVSTAAGVILWDTTGAPEVRIPMPATIWKTTLVAFGPGDRTLVTARDGELAAWDVATGRKLGGVKPAGFDRPSTALGPGTSLAAIWEWDDRGGNHLEIWDVEAGRRLQQIQQISLMPRFGTVTFVGGGRRLFVRSPVTQFISPPRSEEQALWNVADGKLVYRDRTTGYCADGICTPVMAVLAPDGHTLVRAFEELSGSTPRAPAKALTKRRIELVDLDGDRATVLETPPVGIDFSLATDGRALACAATEPGQIAIWELGPRVRRTVKLAETGASRLRLSPHGNLLLVGGEVSRNDGWLSLYRTSDGRRLWHKPHVARREGQDPDLTFDATETLVTCLGRCPPPGENRVVAWDAATGNPAFDLPATGQRILVLDEGGDAGPELVGRVRSARVGRTLAVAADRAGAPRPRQPCDRVPRWKVGGVGQCRRPSSGPESRCTR